MNEELERKSKIEHMLNLIRQTPVNKKYYTRHWWRKH